MAYQCLAKALSLFVILCFIISAFSTAMPAYAQTRNALTNTKTPDAQTIKVGYFQYANYMTLDKDGEPVGFSIDYLEEIARYTNWNYEYVFYHSGQEALDGLANGEVDILPAIYYTKARSTQFLYSDNSMCNTNTTLYVRDNDGRYTYEDFEAFDGMKVGVLRGSHDVETFQQYADANDFAPDIIEYAALADVLVALTNGTVDGAALVNLGSNYDYRIVARFSPEPMFFTFPLDRQLLANELNTAMSALTLHDPEYASKLYKKYFGTNTDQDPVFTEEEYAYMADAPILKVVYDSKRQPLSYTDFLSGEYRGATASLFEDITRITGLQFEYIPAENHVEGLKMVERGEADIFYGLDASTETDSLIVTDAYLSDPIAKISGLSVDEKIIALPEGYWASNSFIDDSEEKDFIYFSTPKECLDTVLKGEADSTYLDINVAIYELSDPKYENLHISTMSNSTNDMCFGISEKSDPLLGSILDRCVQYTAQEKISRWISESALADSPLNFMEILRQYPLQILAIVVAIALIAIFVVLYIAQTRIKSNRRINEITYTDPLTGGWNFYRFQIEVSRLLKEDRNTKYALLYFDFSRFKSFNAVFGFAEGDNLLISSKELLADFVTDKERFAHITADEFVVLMDWHGWDSFIERFNDFDRKLNDLNVVKSHAYRVLVIGGVCLVDERQIDGKISTVSDFIDCARYARESIGSNASRSMATLYNAEMKEKDIAERQLFSEAELALNNGEFVAYYQPKVEMKSNKIVGFEALARWISPTAGLRQPGTFIPLFEQNGFVVELDLYIFRLACKRQQDLLSRGETVVPISCNFSRHHLRRNDLPEKLKAIVDEFKVPTHYLELELTENLVIEDFDRALEICHRLKALGFLISIDDFGSGYSSLGTLQSLPIDILKLDRSFLMSGEIGYRDKTILAGIIQIANRLDIKVVVEGVETIEQKNMLLSFDQSGGTSQGIIAQGFLYSRPVDLKESESQLKKGTLKPQSD